MAVAVIPPDRGPFVVEAEQNWSSIPLPAVLPVHELLLVGDAGQPQRDPLEPTLRLLQRQMTAARGRASHPHFCASGASWRTIQTLRASLRL